ncbi:hypothetical protein C1H46_035931 [Malus baccata]|uniref:Uncharacterized protein n=1 Tax=Malus baccata TaxID=106549 RepID=A0A540KWV9_MALBA|nr:hypothetical protein C1H46_035931 [Malus baccata]
MTTTTLMAALNLLLGVVQQGKSTRPDSPSSSADSSALRGVLSVKDLPKYPRWDDPDYFKWKDEEREILNDIEPVVLLAKETLHSDRYMDGEQLTEEDEKVVVERLLAHHPHSEDKIGCGIDSIMCEGWFGRRVVVCHRPLSV